MRVLVVSNHSLIGQSLVTMLRNQPPDEAFETRMCASASAVAEARAFEANVVVIEAIADFAAGIGTVRGLAEALPGARTIVLGAEEDEVSVYEAISAGAHGYLPSETSPTALGATLRGVERGELGLSRGAALRLVQQFRREAQVQRPRVSPDVLNKLTQREQEILSLMRQGLRSREMAERLYIADATVYKHIQNILDKLHVHTRTQAVLLAELEGNGTTPKPGALQRRAALASSGRAGGSRRGART